MSLDPDAAASLDIVDQSACEFRDYCNHLYYIDGRCNCLWSWTKTAGLVLPVSA